MLRKTMNQILPFIFEGTQLFNEWFPDIPSQKFIFLFWVLILNFRSSRNTVLSLLEACPQKTILLFSSQSSKSFSQNYFRIFVPYSRNFKKKDKRSNEFTATRHRVAKSSDPDAVCSETVLSSRMHDFNSGFKTSLTYNGIQLNKQLCRTSLP